MERRRHFAGRRRHVLRRHRRFCRLRRTGRRRRSRRQLRPRRQWQRLAHRQLLPCQCRRIRLHFRRLGRRRGRHKGDLDGRRLHERRGKRDRHLRRRCGDVQHRQPCRRVRDLRLDVVVAGLSGRTSVRQSLRPHRQRRQRHGGRRRRTYAGGRHFEKFFRALQRRLRRRTDGRGGRLQRRRRRRHRTDHRRHCDLCDRLRSRRVGGAGHGHDTHGRRGRRGRQHSDFDGRQGDARRRALQPHDDGRLRLVERLQRGRRDRERRGVRRPRRQRIQRRERLRRLAQDDCFARRRLPHHRCVRPRRRLSRRRSLRHDRFRSGAGICAQLELRFGKRGHGRGDRRYDNGIYAVLFGLCLHQRQQPRRVYAALRAGGRALCRCDGSLRLRTEQVQILRLVRRRADGQPDPVERIFHTGLQHLSL